MSRAKVRMGRPPLPKGEAMGTLFALRMAPADRKAIERAAKKAGEPVSAWARRVLVNAASK